MDSLDLFNTNFLVDVKDTLFVGFRLTRAVGTNLVLACEYRDRHAIPVGVV